MLNWRCFWGCCLILGLLSPVAFAQTIAPQPPMPKEHHWPLIGHLGKDKNDKKIQRNIIDTISTDPNLNNGTVVEVEVQHGNVLLKGVTGTQDQMEALLKMVQGQPGVKKVSNSVIVTRRKGPMETPLNVGDDIDLVSRIRNVLLKDGFLENNDVNIQTQQHVVTLTGIVQTGKQADQIVEITQNTAGVTQVVDHLHARHHGKRRKK